MKPDPIRLVKPEDRYAADIMRYRQEFLDAGDSLDGCGNLRTCSSAEEWLEQLRQCEREETCPAGWVCASTYLAVRQADDRMVGVIDLRHHIRHPVLSVWGGHIGYSVRPSERRKGYATEMLRQNLENAKALGIDKLLITCDADNTASERTIQKNGGRLETVIEVDGMSIKRYWIEL